ncbi:MAG: hypothetical protein ACQEV7_13170 [Bacillota bacterium]
MGGFCHLLSSGPIMMLNGQIIGKNGQIKDPYGPITHELDR